ncbi:MAG: hypothetical protein IPP72_13760 [Chitinophagaceae bacterium]|nr:hypothetical protein [Chitinophagaceae bacterium]
MKPIVKTETLQTLNETDLNKFDGDYDIFSVDSSFRTSEYALTFSKKFNFKSLPRTNDRINLQSIDSKHLKVTVFKNNKAIKTKIIKGHISQNYFQFSLTTIRPFYFIVNGFATQKTELGC